MPRTSNGQPKARRDIEAPIQAASYQYICLVAPQVICFHVPNGGYRSKAEAAKLKWMGVTPGVHDLIIIDENGLSYLLEMKPPDGVLSQDQKDFHARCRALKIPQAVSHSINETRDALKRWGIKTRESAS